MITGHCNVACRLIMKAVSKGSLAGCLVHLDAGSTDCLAEQNLQIPQHANNRTSLSWNFNACLSVSNRYTSHRPDANLVTPLLTKSKSPTTAHLHHALGSLIEKCEEPTSSILARGKHTSQRSSTVMIHGLDTNWRPPANNMRSCAGAGRLKVVSSWWGRNYLKHFCISSRAWP